jgi:exonuclease VII small subunit
MDLISSDIAREKKISEQRLKRLEDIAKRLNPSTAELIDSGQRNLFDCFDLDYDKSMLGLGARAVDNDDAGPTESHPVNTFLELLPDSQGDDPLLAVACQLLLMTVESEIAKGEPVATLEKIISEMDSRGVSFEEIDEALEHLLMNGSIIEIDDDCFILI